MPAARTYSARPAQPRNSGLAQIHIAKKDLAMADDTYRQILWAVARVKSAKDLDHAGRQKVLDHFKSCGWKPAPPRNAAPGGKTRRGDQGPLPMPRPAVQRSADDQADERWMKARKLWHLLAANGTVQLDTDAALMAFVTRQTRCDAWRFLNSHQVNHLIEGLKKWCARVDIGTGQAGMAKKNK